MSLFTTGVKRPYFVREIARTIDERLNAVRRELEILVKVGMLTTYDEKRRKYYVVNEEFILLDELASIMQKVGPGIEDVLFKNLRSLGDIEYACVAGYFTGTTESPVDLFIIGSVDEKKLEYFVKKIELQVNREIVYTPMTHEEYLYRRNFSDMFLRQIFANPHKELINNLSSEFQPAAIVRKQSSAVASR